MQEQWNSRDKGIGVLEGGALDVTRQERWTSRESNVGLRRVGIRDLLQGERHSGTTRGSGLEGSRDAGLHRGRIAGQRLCGTSRGPQSGV